LKIQPAFALFRRQSSGWWRASVRWITQQRLLCYRWMEGRANNQVSFPIFCISLYDADRKNPNVSRQAVPICSRQAISEHITSAESIQK